MTEVERASAQILAMWQDDSDKTRQEIVQDIARWHLRGVRAARGKTLGYVGIGEGGYIVALGCNGGPVPFPTAAEAEDNICVTSRVARVVVPRKRRGGK